MPERFLLIAEQFNEDLIEFTANDPAGKAHVKSCVRRIYAQPESEDLVPFQPPLIKSDPGKQYFFVCGRFTIIYQFSSENVWIKTLVMEY